MAEGRANTAAASRPAPVLRRASPAPIVPVRPALLQRACACAAKGSAHGEGGDCGRKHTGLQRQGNGAVGSLPPSVHATLRMPGAPLAPVTRVFMQERIGRDFSSVRVHTDAAAAESAREVAAQAYTVGTHVVFERGRYRPETPDGAHLLAHELAHVAQQQGAAVAAPADLRVGAAGSAAEHEADRIADNVLAPQQRAAAVSAQPARLARQPMNAPPNPYREGAPQPAPRPPAPQAEQAVGEVANGTWGRFSADLIRREAIASNGAQPCTLIATMRIRFVQADAAAWPAGRFARWQQEAARAISERWSLRYLLARSGACAQASEPCRRSTVVVRLQPVTSGEHRTVSVRYNKPDGTRSDATHWYEADVHRPRPDMRTSQATATHEFGHLLGDDHVAANTQECRDARVADPKNPEPDVCYGRSREERAGVMGHGEVVRVEDYQPFLAPMQTATGCSWRVDGGNRPTAGTSALLTGLLAGGLLGLAGGAAVGAMLGPVGMLVGGLVGAAIGGLLGASFGAAIDG